MEQLKKYAAQFNIHLTDDQLILFEKYYNFLIEYNQKVNLTAITQKDDVIIKHFLDSIILLNFFKIRTNCRLIDIGTGAGFPGVPLKIVRPDLDIVLIDARNKKVEFLNQLFSLLNIFLATQFMQVPKNRLKSKGFCTILMLLLAGRL